MRGGRVQELYKNKGDRNETKSHRGILVQNLPGSMHASFLKRDIDEHYMKFIDETQCGCAKGSELQQRTRKVLGSVVPRPKRGFRQHSP